MNYCFDSCQRLPDKRWSPVWLKTYAAPGLRFTSTMPAATSTSAPTRPAVTGSPSHQAPNSRANTGVRNTNTDSLVTLAAFAEALGSVPARRESRCCAKSRQARRRTQVMAVPLPSPSTPHGEIFRATRRDGPVLARCCVSRHSFGTTKLRVSCLASR